MTSLRISDDGRVLCALYLAQNCPGYVLVGDLYEDEYGDKWDICRWCKEFEDAIIASK